MTGAVRGERIDEVCGVRVGAGGGGGRQESDGEVKTARSWMGDWENPLSIGSFHRQENNLFFKKFFIVCQVLC